MGEPGANPSVILEAILRSTVASVQASLESLEDANSESASGESLDTLETGGAILGSQAWDESLVKEVRSNSESSQVEAVFADKISGSSIQSDEFHVPKYFQAIITLFVCFFLLFFTLAIISQTRRLCQKSSCTKKIPLQKVGSDHDRSHRRGSRSPSDFECMVTDEEGNYQTPHIDRQRSRYAEKHASDRHFDYYTSKASPTMNAQMTPKKPVNAHEEDSIITPEERKKQHEKDQEQDLLKLKKVRFVRRVSGPFGEDAIDFVGQTYKAKYMEAPIPKKTGDAFHKKQSIKKPPPTTAIAPAEHEKENAAHP